MVEQSPGRFYHFNHASKPMCLSSRGWNTTFGPLLTHAVRLEASLWTDSLLISVKFDNTAGYDFVVKSACYVVSIITFLCTSKNFGDMWRFIWSSQKRNGIGLDGVDNNWWWSLIVICVRSATIRRQTMLMFEGRRMCVMDAIPLRIIALGKTFVSILNYMSGLIFLHYVATYVLMFSVFEYGM